MSEPMVLFPDSRVFVLRPVVITASILLALALFITGGLYTALDDPGLLLALPLGLSLLVILFTAIERRVVFNKTRYEIYPDRIIHKTGGLLSEHTTNLPLRNVTQIDLTLPFLEHFFYKTGHVAVHAAGTSSSQVRFISIRDSQEIYTQLEERLRQNGFSIEREKLIQKERPGIIGVLLDGDTAGKFFALLILPLTLVPALTDMGMSWLLTGLISLFGIIIAMGGLLLYAVLSFIDRMQRTYTLWDDCIEYEDGFMTRRQKLIPFENLADTNMEQSFVKRLFGMADIIVSCQGASGNIHFPSMPRAQEFRDNLDRLLSTLGRPDPIAADGLLDSDPSADSASAAPDLTRPDITPRFRLPVLGDPNRPGKTYRVSPLRFAAPWLTAIPFILLFLPQLLKLTTLFELELPYLTEGIATASLAVITLFIIGIAGQTLFIWLTHTFTMGPRSVAFTMEMVSEKKTTEFTNDKITSIRVYRSVFDKLFGTASIAFYSIGANAPLYFRSIPDYSAFKQELEKNFGLPSQSPQARFLPRPTFASILLTNLSLIFTMLLLAAALLIIPYFFPIPNSLAIGGAVLALGLALFHVLHDSLFHSRSSLNFYEHHLMAQTGIINHRYIYVAYHDVKNIAALKYPGQNLGMLSIEAGGAGSRAVIEHIPDPFALQDHLDSILYARPMRDIAQADTFDTTQVALWKPEAKNDLIQNISLAALSVVGIPFIPLIFLYTKAFYRRAEDILQTHRICTIRGLFFRRRDTVLINRIDQIQVRRGAMNSLCKNGGIEVYTVGSGVAEAELGPHSNFQEIYDALNHRAA